MGWGGVGERREKEKEREVKKVSERTCCIVMYMYISSEPSVN